MKTLITTAQDVTTSWVDLGSPVAMRNRSRCGLWVNVDINNAQNFRFRALAFLDENGTAGEFNLPIKTVGSSDVKVETEYFELNVDADQKLLLEVVTNRIVPWIQFQISAGTAGATAGQVDNAYVTFDDY